MDHRKLVLVVWLLALTTTVEISATAAATQQSPVVVAASFVHDAASKWLKKHEDILHKFIDHNNNNNNNKDKDKVTQQQVLLQEAGKAVEISAESDLQRDAKTNLESHKLTKLKGAKLLQVASRSMREASRLFVASLAGHLSRDSLNSESKSKHREHLDAQAGVTSLMQTGTDGNIATTSFNDSHPQTRKMAVALALLASICAIVGTFLMDRSLRTVNQYHMKRAYGMFERLSVLLGPSQGGVLHLFSSFGFGLFLLLISFSMITRVLTALCEDISDDITYPDQAFLLSSTNPFVVCNLGNAPTTDNVIAFSPISIQNTGVPANAPKCAQPKAMIANFNNPRYEIPAGILTTTSGKTVLQLAVFTSPTDEIGHPFVTVQGYDGSSYPTGTDYHFTVGWNNVYNGQGSVSSSCRYNVPVVFGSVTASNLATYLPVTAQQSRACGDDGISFASPFSGGKAATGVDYVVVGLVHSLSATPRPAITDANILTYYENELRTWCGTQKPLIVSATAQDLTVSRTFFLFSEGCSQYFTDRDLSTLI